MRNLFLARVLLLLEKISSLRSDTHLHFRVTGCPFTKNASWVGRSSARGVAIRTGRCRGLGLVGRKLPSHTNVSFYPLSPVRACVSCVVLNIICCLFSLKRNQLLVYVDDITHHPPPPTRQPATASTPRPLPPAPLTTTVPLPGTRTRTPGRANPLSSVTPHSV